MQINTPASMTSGFWLNIRIIKALVGYSSMPTTRQHTTDMMTDALRPSLTRCWLPAPMFCPV